MSSSSSSSELAQPHPLSAEEAGENTSLLTQPPPKPTPLLEALLRLLDLRLIILLGEVDAVTAVISILLRAGDGEAEAEDDKNGP